MKITYSTKITPPKMGAEAMAVPGIVALMALAQHQADQLNALKKREMRQLKELARLKKAPKKIAPKYR
jgi:hypothetical protein